jgi:hypothetical protein
MKHNYLPLLSFVLLIVSVAMVRTAIDVIRHDDWSRLKFTGKVFLGFLGLGVFVGLALLSSYLLSKTGGAETLLSAMYITALFGCHVVTYLLSIVIAVGVIGCFFMTALADRYELRS